MAITSAPIEHANLEPADPGVARSALRRPLHPALLVVLADVVALSTPFAVRGATLDVGLVFTATAVALLALGGTYRRRLNPALLDDLPRLVGPVLIGLAAAVIAVTGGDVKGQATSALVAAGALALGRLLTYGASRSWRRRGRGQRNAVVVGAGAIGIELHRLLREHPEFGLRSVGLVDDVEDTGPIPLVGGLDDLHRIVHQHHAQVVIVAFGPTAEQEMIATLRGAVGLDVDVYVVPRFFELGLAPSSLDVEQIWGIPVYRVRRAALSTGSWRIKRITDVTVSGLALAVLAPVLGLLALAVKLTSPGPVLFRQLRVGQHGRPIEVLKFRSMRINDDSDVTWTVRGDPRLTPIGKWLRRLSLDELPQLWNVLRGDMSLIGPRPERPYFVEAFRHEVSGYGDRHRLPVGLTGLAQIHGLRGDTSIAERARFDNYYIEHWSPWHDMKIVLRTVSSVVRDALERGARQ